MVVDTAAFQFAKPGPVLFAGLKCNKNYYDL